MALWHCKIQQVSGLKPCHNKSARKRIPTITQGRMGLKLYLAPWMSQRYSSSLIMWVDLHPTMVTIHTRETSTSTGLCILSLQQQTYRQDIIKTKVMAQKRCLALFNIRITWPQHPSMSRKGHYPKRHQTEVLRFKLSEPNQSRNLIQPSMTWSVRTWWTPKSSNRQSANRWCSQTGR